jgi:hypothetical protein
MLRGAGQLSSGWRSGSRRSCRHRGAVLGGRALPGAVTRASRAAQRVVAGRENVRTPARPGVALSASLVPPWGRPSNRSSGRPASTRPVSRRLLCPGVRTDRHPGSAALPPHCPRRAGPWSGSGWRAAPVGRNRSTRPVVRGRRGRLPASGPDGKGWRGVGRAWLARGSTVAPGCRLAGLAAAPPGRHGAGSGPGYRPRGGEHGTEQVLTAPKASWGRSPAWCPTMGLDQEVVGHATRSLPGVGSMSSSSGGSIRSGGGQSAAAARPQHARRAVHQTSTAR